jgi:hypothetical protein
MKRSKQEKIFYYTMPGLYAKKILELETCAERVCWLLEKNEHLRNCDKCLIIYYWKHVDALDNVSKDNIHSLTPSESIRRVRQHIQNDLGLWPPTEEKVLLARKINESAVQDWILNHKRIHDD